jgi:hypothetical protein
MRYLITIARLVDNEAEAPVMEIEVGRLVASHVAHALDMQDVVQKIIGDPRDDEIQS